MAEKQFGMLVDLAKCIGCNACAVACKQENEVPQTKFNTWIESWDVEVGDRIARTNVSHLCNHCAEAPCVHVCPTGASYRTEEGVVMVDDERCIGCKYCMAVCPYQVRWQKDDTGDIHKCTFCYHRTSNGLLPACATACVTSARIFGDVNDPESDISKRLAEADHEVMMADLNLGSHVYYLGLSATEAMPRVSAIHKGGNVLKPYEGRQ